MTRPTRSVWDGLVEQLAAGDKPSRDHGQQCPCWVRRGKATIWDCNCWRLPKLLRTVDVVRKHLGAAGADGERITDDNGDELEHGSDDDLTVVRGRE